MVQDEQILEWYKMCNLLNGAFFGLFKNEFFGMVQNKKNFIIAQNVFFWNYFRLELLKMSKDWNGRDP